MTPNTQLVIHFNKIYGGNYCSMKKFTATILLVMILIFSSSCQKGVPMIIKDNDHQKALKQIETVLEAIQNKNDNKLKLLFSQSTLKHLQSYEESINELFVYFQGSVISFDDGAGPFVETMKEDNLVYQLMESSFIVKTDICEYRFAMQYITQGNAEDVGITSLYIIKTTDDKNLNDVYWGDGKFTPGIHIAIPNGI